MAEPHPQVRISIGSRFDNIELVVRVAEASLGHLGVDGEAVDQVNLALREAVANAVLHGHQQRDEEIVQVDLELEKEEIVVRVRDHGGGFDPDQVPDPLAPENLLKPNGRGILLMRRMMDQVEFRNRNGSGTTAILRKRLDGAPGEESSK